MVSNHLVKHSYLPIHKTHPNNLNLVQRGLQIRTAVCHRHNLNTNTLCHKNQSKNLKLIWHSSIYKTHPTTGTMSPAANSALQALIEKTSFTCRAWNSFSFSRIVDSWLACAGQCCVRSRWEIATNMCPRTKALNSASGRRSRHFLRAKT